MKKLLFLFLVLIFTGSLTAQYVQPESVIWDNVNKRYYISNAGSGTIVMRDWGGTAHSAWASQLIQPKAMLIIDSTLYVLDYTTIKTYNINTARFLKNETVPGATFLNDFCMDAEGNFYMTDTYDNSIIKYDKKHDKYIKLPLKGFIEKPNGIILDSNRLVIVSFRPKSPIQAISLDDYKVTTLVKTDIDYMDGITKDGKGNVYISAWVDQNPGSGKVYRMKDDFTGDIETVITNLDGPADIYYNQLSDTLVVPNMDGNWVGFYPFIDPPPAPELIEPENGSYIKRYNFFRWSEPRAAKTYTVQVADNYAFTDAFEIPDLTYPYVTLELGLDNCDSVYWRVKAFNSKGESPWSESRFIIPALPVKPALIFPTDKSTDIPLNVKFMWGYHRQGFKLMIDTTDDFSSDYLMEIETEDTVSKNITLLSNTKYYWKVQGVICNKYASSDIWSFTTVDATLPSKTNLKSPDDKATNISLDSVEFIWTKTDYTDYYTFNLSDRSNLSNIIESDSIAKDAYPDDVFYTLQSTLEANKTYYWAVSSNNKFGSTQSDIWSFTTKMGLDVEEFNDENKLLIIPNPTFESFRIRFNSAPSPNLKIELVNLVGIKYPVEYHTAGNYVDVTTGGKIPQGIYLLRILSNSEISIRKIIIRE